MTLVDVGSSVVLYSTRDKKFISGLTKKEVYNYSITVSGEVHPWIASLWGTKYIAVGIGRMFRLIKLSCTIGRHIWLDNRGRIWGYSPEKSIFCLYPEKWKEYEECDCWCPLSDEDATNTTDEEGIFLFGNNMVYIKVGNAIKAYRGLLDWKGQWQDGPKWETSINGTFYDFQFNLKYWELVIPNYDGNTVSLIEGGVNGGRVKATKDIGFKSGAVAIDKYGRYWFQEWEGNRITVRNPEDLSPVEITINGETHSDGTFEVPFISYATGIGENANFDIIMCDYGSNYSAFFSAENDYENIIRISLGAKCYMATPLGEKSSFFLATTKDKYQCSLFNPVSQVLTSVIIHGHNLSGQGDPGLARYKTWGRSWRPDTSVIYDYLYRPVTEES